jgi:hypothetical protein
VVRWAAAFDIDELLVLHKEECLPAYITKKGSGSLGLVFIEHFLFLVTR